MGWTVVPPALVTPGLLVSLAAATPGDFSFLASIDLTYPRRFPSGAVLGSSALRGSSRGFARPRLVSSSVPSCSTRAPT